MSYITIWTIVLAEEYDLLQYTLSEAISSQFVKDIVILHTGPNLPANAYSLEKSYSKIHEFHKSYGQGFTLPVDEGGFDQINARNHILQLAETYPAEWLMQVDADDFYLQHIFEQITTTSAEFDSISCSCINLINENRYWNKREIMTESGFKIIDPHIRIWKKHLKKRFKLCEHSAKTNINATMHCGVDFNIHPYWKTTLIKDFVHYHLHGILEKKNINYWQNNLGYIDIKHHTTLISCIENLRKCKAC